MAGMNRQLSLPALQAILRDFERQNERMDMTSDVMGDAIDDAFEQEGEQEESEELVSQVRVSRLEDPSTRVLTAAAPAGASRNRVHTWLAATGRAHRQCGRRATGGHTHSDCDACRRRPGR